MEDDISLISDEQLRHRLAQYGFPNLPVTETTRKVLVKKLRNAMDGKNLKRRRETVAVMTASSDDETGKEASSRNRVPNRRATLATALKKKDASAEGRPVKAFISSKGSLTADTVQKKEDSEDDDFIETTMKRRSKSRTTTPILAKSDTVRTSYKASVEVEEKNTPPILPSHTSSKISLRNKKFTTSHTDTFNKLDFSEQSKSSSPSIKNSNSYQKYKFTKIEDEPLELNETNTPYLSNFAKRLEKLRAEPLSGHVTDFHAESNYSGTKNLVSPKKQDFMKNLSNPYDSHEREYNLGYYLYVFFMVMIVIAIYVLFFM